ncbi:MAG: hypothetical protein LC808_03565, partial [Actinobacteria bacterium]|nr:hypothetical protein [Actinomycetota bacterium]
MRRLVELEVGLHRRDDETWTADLRCSGSDGEADVGDTVPAFALDLKRVADEVMDDHTYGMMLGQALFGDPRAQNIFRQARADADKQQVPLRIRLFIGAGAESLHDLQWEKLCDPLDGEPMLTSDRFLFSRFLQSADWRSVGIRSRWQLRAAIMISNPRNLDSIGPPGGRGLVPIDTHSELRRARESLRDIEITTLASVGGTAGTASLESLDRALRTECDILYLVCHGYMAGGETQLVLEND